MTTTGLARVIEAHQRAVVAIQHVQDHWEEIPDATHEEFESILDALGEAYQVLKGLQIEAN